jgi:hypothetical protein
LNKRATRMQQACNKRATSVQQACNRRATSVQQAGNKDATSVQQGCNKDATRVQQGCNKDATRVRQGCLGIQQGLLSPCCTLVARLLSRYACISRHMHTHNKGAPGIQQGLHEGGQQALNKGATSDYACSTCMHIETHAHTHTRHMHTHTHSVVLLRPRPSVQHTHTYWSRVHAVCVHVSRCASRGALMTPSKSHSQ